VPISRVSSASFIDYLAATDTLDGVVDCGPDDDSDETSETIFGSKCPEFDCNNGRCRQFADICDGIDNCG